MALRCDTTTRPTHTVRVIMGGSVERFIRFRLTASGSYWDVLTQVRRQRFSGKALLTGLRSEDREVRQVLASLELPPRMLAELAHDPNVGVRLAVASNLAATTELLLILVGDADHGVRSIAQAEVNRRGWK